MLEEKNVDVQQEDTNKNNEETKEVKAEDITYNSYSNKEAFEDIEEGIVYLPLGCVIDERLERKVKINRMKARDRLEMSRKKNQKDPMKAFDLILNRCVITIGDKPATETMIQSLSTGDRDTLFLALRRYSIGNKMVYKTKCGECKEELEIELLLSDIPIKGCENHKIMVKNGRPYIYSRNEELQLEMEIRIPDNHDFKKLKKFILEQDPELDYQLYKLCLSKFGKEEGPFSIDFILDLEIPQIKWLESVVRSLPGPNWDFDISCQFCDAIGKVNLGNIDFLS